MAIVNTKIDGTLKLFLTGVTAEETLGLVGYVMEQGYDIHVIPTTDTATTLAVSLEGENDTLGFLTKLYAKAEQLRT